MEKFPFRSYFFSLVILTSDIVLPKLAHEQRLLSGKKTLFREPN